MITVTKGRRMSWEDYAAYMGEMRNVYKVLVGKLQGKGR
jgi:hypothetical protein